MTDPVGYLAAIFDAAEGTTLFDRIFQAGMKTGEADMGSGLYPPNVAELRAEFERGYVESHFTDEDKELLFKLVKSKVPETWVFPIPTIPITEEILHSIINTPPTYVADVWPNG